MAKGKATIGVKLIPLLDKAVMDVRLYNRLKDLVESISEDDELLKHALELRQIARQIVEEAEVA